MYVLYRSDSDGDPTEVVLKDKSIISVVLLWALLVIGLTYMKKFNTDDSIRDALEYWEKKE